MTPDQFLVQLRTSGPAPAYLFLGPESYQRERCRRALNEAALPPEDREAGFIRHDLDEVSLREALDDARSLSLFVRRRLIWLGSAEAALPRGRAAAAAGEDGDEGPPKGEAATLAAYVRDPAPATVVVVDASRFDFEGDDKARLERVHKFYSAVPAQVEFRHFTVEAARQLTQSLAREAGLKIGLAEIGLLVEALGANAARIAVEIEKLRLFAGSGRAVTAEDIARLVPDAQETTVFALVAALGRSDRQRSLDLLGTLVREGAYLPLVLTFLATQFRLALVAREAGLRSAAQVQAHLLKLGARMWRERSEQVYQTAALFSKERLESALKSIFAADRALRDANPDDRIVMEQLIFALTSAR